MSIKGRRCLVCAKKSSSSNEICSYCNFDKTKSDLTASEKKLRTKFTSIRQLGILQFIGGAIFMFFGCITGSLFGIIYALFFMVLGIALGTYQSWAHKASILLYFLSLVVIVVNFFSPSFSDVHPGSRWSVIVLVVIQSIFLYCLITSSEAIALVKKNISGQIKPLKEQETTSLTNAGESENN
jgi:hypothetical protein